MPCRLSALRSALVGAMLGLALFASPANATPGETRPGETSETSLRAGIDNFAAYLKSETNAAMAMAARLARDHQDSLAAAKSYLERHLSAWRDLLSDRKAGAGTLGTEPESIWEAWRRAAIASWAAIEHQARDALDWIAIWMRNQSLSDQNPETPV